MRLLLGRLGLLVAVLSCQPNTTRPPFTPVPEAAGTEVRLPVPQATRRLAEALKADSIPVRTVRIRDGYIETGWFTTAARRAAGSRTLGPGVVRVRAWAGPARRGSSLLTVETVYRPLRDPSLPDRELERQVAPDHPVALKVVAALQQLVKRYGGAPPEEEEQPAAQPEEAPPPE